MSDTGDFSGARPFTCKGCGCSMRCKGYDGWCLSCTTREEQQVEPRPLRVALRALHLSTAGLLQREGHPEEAAWHYLEAERLR